MIEHLPHRTTIPASSDRSSSNDESEDSERWGEADSGAGSRRPKMPRPTTPAAERRVKTVSVVTATGNGQGATLQPHTADKSRPNIRIDQLVAALAASPAAATALEAWRIIAETVKNLGFRGRNGQLWTVPSFSDRSTQRHADGGATITLIGHQLIIENDGRYRIDDILNPRQRTIFRKPSQKASSS